MFSLVTYVFCPRYVKVIYNSYNLVNITGYVLDKLLNKLSVLGALCFSTLVSFLYSHTESS